MVRKRMARSDNAIENNRIFVSPSVVSVEFSACLAEAENACAVDGLSPNMTVLPFRFLSSFSS